MNQPEKIGPFRIEKTIGRGGMGAVYKAVYEEVNEVVALKVLLDSVAEDSELRSRFEAEIETLKRLRHPNIVRLYGFGQEEGLLYYAMEYVDGPSLASLLKSGGFFSWEQVVHIGVEVCKALRHAHDRGVIHRDIKPANILLLETGEVKVSDYGIAHFFGSSRLTTANMVIGTIEFMSPEQAQAGPLTPKSDIYSLGALLYALLTGVPPYVARTLPEILQKYRSGPPDSIRYRRPEVPAVLDMFIMELLRVQPDKRPLDARIIGRRLEAIRVAFSQFPEENPFKDGLQQIQDSYDNQKVADIERQLDEDSFGDIIIGAKKKKGNRSGTQPTDSSDGKHFFESFSTSAPGGFSFGNSQEFSTGSVTMVDGHGNDNSRYDFPEKTDQTAGLGADSSSNKAALSETGFDLSDSVLTSEQVGEDKSSPSSSHADDSSLVQPQRRLMGTASNSLNTNESVGESVPLSATESNLSDPVQGDVSASGTRANPKTAEFPTVQGDTSIPCVTQAFDSNRSTGLVDNDFELNALPEPDGDSVVIASTSVHVDSGSLSESTLSSVTAPQSPSVLETPTRWTGSLKNSTDSHGVEITQPNKANETDSINVDLVQPANATGSDAGLSESARSRSKKKRPGISSSISSTKDGHVSTSSPGKSLSRGSGTSTESTGGYTTKTSHFTVVDEHELGNFGLETETNSYYVSIKIWIFSCILICVGVLFWYSLRAPSADSLYLRITTRIDNSEDDEYLSALRSVERECRNFVSLYPNDSRVEKIQNFLSELDLGNLERRLERRIERKSKDSSLSPVERAYIEAIYEVKNDPERGIAKLKAFVEIFSSEEHEGKNLPISSEDTQQSMKKRKLFDRTVNGQCVILAKRRLSQAELEFEKSKAAGISLLEGRLEYADALDQYDPERANTIRHAIIGFYKDQLWAQPILEQAQAKLDKSKPESKTGTKPQSNVVPKSEAKK